MLTDYLRQRRKTDSPPRLLVLLILSIVLLTACEPFPRDPRDTLDNARERGTLRVGVVENPPWITGSPEEVPGGVEARLIEEFARALGLEADWQWGTLEDHFAALENHELDLVAGGVTRASPWSTRVAFTLPYLVSHAGVGVPAGMEPPPQLEGQRVAMLGGSGLRRKLEAEEAEVVTLESLAGAALPVAARDWQLAALGLRPTRFHLQKFEHAMAVPLGENAFIMALEDHLLAQDAVRLAAELAHGWESQP